MTTNTIAPAISTDALAWADRRESAERNPAPLPAQERPMPGTTHHQPQTTPQPRVLTADVEMVHGGHLRPGDRLLVEAVVVEPPEAAYPPGAHVYMRVVNRLVNTGDQYLWTWSGTREERPIVRLVGQPDTSAVTER